MGSDTKIPSRWDRTQLERWEIFRAEFSCLAGVDKHSVAPGTHLRDLAPSGAPRYRCLRALEILIPSMVEGQAKRLHDMQDAFEAIDRVPQMTGLDDRMEQRVRLRPLVPSDIPALYHESVMPDSGFRWRFRGATPGIDAFASRLHDGVLVQFAVESSQNGSLAGLVAAYNSRMDNGTAFLAFQGTGAPAAATGLVYDGMFIFIEYLFATWNLRKLYAEVPGFNEEVIRLSSLEFMQEEGRLSNNEYHDGRWHHTFIFALPRESWGAFAARWHEALGRIRDSM